MKKKSIIYLLLFSLTCGFSLNSCEDMLDVQSDRYSYETAQDTLYAYWGILKSLQNVGERYVLLGELRGDLVMANRYDGEVSDSLLGIANFTSQEDGMCRYLAARDYYAVINNCNAYIAAADTNRIVYGASGATDGKYMMREYAQVEAIRAWVYLQLVLNYGEVPFYLDPLTNTDAIDDFFANGHARETVSPMTLPDKIGPRLLPLIAKEDIGQLTYPIYGSYTGMVHSSYCFFPLHLVMGDIYLNANRYEEAAAEYYKWMAYDSYKSVPSKSKCIASTIPYRDKVEYSISSYRSAFNVSSGTRGDDETITVIPSFTNKLLGTVLRGVNEAFGFTAELSMNTTSSGDTAKISSSVTLSPITSKRQFIASDEFTNIARHYPSITIDNERQNTITETGKYAYDYVHTESINPDTAFDGRYGWYSKVWSKTAGNEYTADSFFISKQNIGGVYSNTYPVIYRRALVWLRFAEAINRAGFPEYAYAVLRDGLFKRIVPRVEDAKFYLVEKQPMNMIRTVEEIAITPEGAEEGDDTEPIIETVVTLSLLPCGAEESEYNLEANQTFVTYEITQDVDAEEYVAIMNAPDEEEALLCDSIEFTYDVLRTYLSLATKAPVLQNQHKWGETGVSLQACNYIPLNQLLKAQNVSWLDFTVGNKCSPFQFDNNDGNKKCLGIHQRGSGYVTSTSWNDTIYCFDKNIKDKWKDFDGSLNYYTVSAADYSDYQQNLIKAVEELIIDELALETGFEGNRYTDLLRFSTRDNRGAAWLTERINRRGGATVTITDDNKYLKLPADIYR